jgi:hypothetical protein
MSTPEGGLLVGDRNDAAAIRLTLRPQGLLAPLDQPTSTPWGRAAGHLYFRAFTPKGRPPGAPDMTTWAIGKLPGRDSHPLDRCCYGLHQKTGPSAPHPS